MLSGIETLEVNGLTHAVLDNNRSKTLIDPDRTMNENNLCIRFIRKKFKCIIIFLLTIIALSELLNNILSKVDKSFFQNLSNKISNYTNDSKIETPQIISNLFT